MIQNHKASAGVPDRNINALYDYMVRAQETNKLTLDILTRKLPAQLIKNWVDWLNGK